MKFVHTADWQIGMRAAHVGGVGQRVRDERIEAGRRAVRVARDHGADFLLLAGDTFEDNAIERVLVQKVADLLAEFAGPVYVIPGNHDPLVPGSVWEHPAWRSHTNLHILDKAEPLEIPGGMLYPCPLFERHARRDPTDWIAADGSGTIAVGLAHGTVEGVPQDPPEFPIARDAASRAGLDYLALGHWHSTVTYDRMAYSGTHETTKFGERDSGNVLMVEIAARGETPRLTPIRTGGLTWLAMGEPIRAEGDLARLRERIEKIAEPGQTLLDIQLSGVLHASEQAELGRIEELADARFLYHRIDAAGLFPAPEDDRWLAEFPDGPLKEAARRLVRLADPVAVDGRPEGATPEVATRALGELYAMFREVPA
ncbi:MAG: DNA repair exonuclease [Planctomycetia bacterium]|nr:DNA repair exonuclease [Planctomycetia bacterium]